jgi:hypothetical protein
MTLPLVVPHLRVEAAVELIAAEDGVQLNVLDRNGMIAQMARVKFNEKGELELNMWASDRIPDKDDPWESITLLFTEDTMVAE